MTWYYANLGTFEVEPVEIDRATQKCVFVMSRWGGAPYRQDKVQTYGRYFETEAAAVAFLLPASRREHEQVVARAEQLEHAVRELEAKERAA